MDLSLNFTQVLQLSAMPTLAVAVVESSLTMLDAQGLSPLSSAAQIVELVSTAASIVKMLELDVQVVCDYVVSVFLPVCHLTLKNMHEQISRNFKYTSKVFVSSLHVVH